MKLTLGGVTYQADMLSLYRLSIREAREIKRHTTLTLADWRFGLRTFFREDPDILLGVVYVLKSRAGEVVNWDELDGLNAQDIVDGIEMGEIEDVDREQLDQARVRLDAAAKPTGESPALPGS